MYPFCKRLYIVSALAALLCIGCSSDKYVTMQGYAQGGTFHVIYKLPGGGLDEKTVNEAIVLALREIDQSLSGYNKSSLLSRLNAGEDLPLDTLFIECFERSLSVWQESGGAFDPSAAPLFDLWGFGFEYQGSVSDSAIDSLMEFVGMDKISLSRRSDGSCHLVRSDPRIRLNFNAIAQGFSCDIVARRLESFGCFDYLVEVGREIVCRGQSSRGGLWRIGIDKPFDGNFDEGASLQKILEVSDCGVVTSGNYRKFYVVDGQKYAHTIDPRIGRPVQHNLLSATIIASDATEADAYATWAMVVGRETFEQLMSSRPDIRYCLIYDDAGVMKLSDR